MFLSLIPSGIGFVLLVYGKKQGRWPQLTAGIALLAYPYFADTVASLMGIGAAIVVALWVAIRLGW
ncbi:MAG: amino acid transport protein [Actinobacteria bacterium]|nr:amino acid transport protein [Actinomycetota bacterium]